MYVSIAVFITLLYVHQFIHISTMFYTSLFSRIN